VTQRTTFEKTPRAREKQAKAATARDRRWERQSDPGGRRRTRARSSMAPAARSPLRSCSAWTRRSTGSPRRARSTSTPSKRRRRRSSVGFQRTEEVSSGKAGRRSTLVCRQGGPRTRTTAVPPHQTMTRTRHSRTRSRETTTPRGSPNATIDRDQRGYRPASTANLLVTGCDRVWHPHRLRVGRGTLSGSKRTSQGRASAPGCLVRQRGRDQVPKQIVAAPSRVDDGDLPCGTQSGSSV
jgi:hypothetical protein